VREGEGDGVGGAAVEGGLPPVVEDNVVGRPLEALGLDLEGVVRTEDGDLAVGAAVEAAGVGDGEHRCVVRNHVETDAAGREAEEPLVLHEERHVADRVVLTLAGGAEDMDVKFFAREGVKDVTESLCLVVIVLLLDMDNDVRIAFPVRSRDRVEVADDYIRQLIAIKRTAKRLAGVGFAEPGVEGAVAADDIVCALYEP